jgi:hypothetical protein
MSLRHPHGLVGIAQRIFHDYFVSALAENNADTLPIVRMAQLVIDGG